MNVVSILLVVLIIGFGGFFLLDQYGVVDENGQGSPIDIIDDVEDLIDDVEDRHIPIESEFEDKIVYTTDGSVDTEPLIQHCAAKGGTFNECGSVCESDAEICIQVCAFTCELQ